MGDCSDSDSSSEWEQDPGVISIPELRYGSNLTPRQSSLAGLPMGNSGVSQQIHNTGPIPVLGPSGVSSYLRSCSPGRVPKEYYGHSDSSSSARSIDRNPYMFRRSMEYSSDTESSETSSSSDSYMSSNEPSTSMGYNSDSIENPPPNKRIKSDTEESKKSAMTYNCPVCLEDVREKQPVSTNCGHIFCKACIVRAVDMGRICPLCGVDEPKFHRIFL